MVFVGFLFAMGILASYMVICMVSRIDPDFSRGPSIFWGAENVDPRAKFNASKLKQSASQTAMEAMAPVGSMIYLCKMPMFKACP